jgi:hypothetical protein
MNIGAVFSGAIVDFFNIGYKEGVPVLGTTISGNRLVVFSCAISVIFSFMVTFLFLRDIKVTERAEAAIDSTKDFEEYKPKQQTFWVSMNTPLLFIITFTTYTCNVFISYHRKRSRTS